VIRASVVVCTRNRAARLGECLAHLADQAVAPHHLDARHDGEGDSDRGDRGIEVIVVDNGSTDGTAALAAAWCGDDPRRRRLVSEPVAGLSRARNRGIGAARGDVVLFIDDDAVAPRGWVAAHLAAYDRDPGVAAVGGPVALRWPDGRPAWLAPRLDHWFSALDHGDRAIAFPPPHGPYGTNMSVRRAALDAVERPASGAGPFDERLGRRGRSLVSSEEGDLFERLWAVGGRIAYEPAALVLHSVTDERASRRWVLRRGWAQGRSNARRRVSGMRPTRPELATVCRAEAGMAARGLGGAVRSAATGGQAAILDELARRSGHLAAAVELVWLGMRR
jgi:glycosyltransferase involved in cell wall biosynthesis